MSMRRIYPTSEGQVRVADPESTAVFEGDHIAGVDVPEALAEHLLNTHIGGKPAWESDAARSIRLVEEAEERDRDPKSLLDEIRALREEAAEARAKAAADYDPEDDSQKVVEVDPEIKAEVAKKAAPAKKIAVKKAPAKKVAPKD